MIYRYSEAIYVLYAHNTFRFINLSTIISFSSIILPQRLKSIRSLHLHWEIHMGYFKLNQTQTHRLELLERPVDTRWETVCQILADMSGLRELRVLLLQHPFWYVWREFKRQDEIFEPMRRIQGLEKYEVEVNWKVDPSPLLAVSIECLFTGAW